MSLSPAPLTSNTISAAYRTATMTWCGAMPPGSTIVGKATLSGEIAAVGIVARGERILPQGYRTTLRTTVHLYVCFFAAGGIVGAGGGAIWQTS